MSDSDRLEVADLLSQKVESKVIPGAVVVAKLPGSEVTQWACGEADAINPRAIHPDTLFDLASLTKVVSTTTLVLALISAGELTLEQPLRTFLPGGPAGISRPITLAELLTHTSGLPATIDLEAQQAEGASPSEAILRSVPLRTPGERVVYSDIGFMLLGMVVETVTGKPLREGFSELIAQPLGMRWTGFGPVSPEITAATEPDKNGVPWCGTVHDENTRVMGGVAGHAGLFSTAEDLGRFAQWWLSDDDLLVSASLRRESERCRTVGADGCRGLGWVCRGDGFDFLVDWPQQAVSHSGFTGTSIALDPGTGSWVVALTNAVHYGRHKEQIRAFRRELHQALRPACSPAQAPDPSAPSR